MTDVNNLYAAKLHALVQKHIDGWYEKNADEAEIKKYVYHKLEKDREDILSAMLGIKKNSWGDTEISPTFENMLRKVFAEEIEALLKDIKNSVPAIPETTKKKIAKKYQDHVLNHVERHFTYSLSQDAAIPIINELTKQFNADSLKKTMELLKG